MHMYEGVRDSMSLSCPVSSEL